MRPVSISTTNVPSTTRRKVARRLMETVVEGGSEAKPAPEHERPARVEARAFDAIGGIQPKHVARREPARAQADAEAEVGPRAPHLAVVPGAARLGEGTERHADDMPQVVGHGPAVLRAREPRAIAREGVQRIGTQAVAQADVELRAGQLILLPV